MVLATFLAWLALREVHDPRLILFIDDILDTAPVPVEVDLGQGLAVRMYSDTRPHVGKIDELQKGLVLVSEGRPLVEEGFGLGAPIVRYGDRTYNSRTAEVDLGAHGSGYQIVKRYEVDVVDLPSGPLTRKYSDVPSWGTVVVTTSIAPTSTDGVVVLEMSADLSGLEPGWSEAFMMNEQGARAFRRYQPDVDVPQYTMPSIWEQELASCSCWHGPRAELRFCVNTEPGRLKYVGRERYTQYHWIGTYQLSWSGIDLHLEPDDTLVDYIVTIGQSGSTLEDAVSAFCP